MLNDPCLQLVTYLSGALKGLRLYPVEHPHIQKQLEALAQLLEDRLQGRPSIRLGVLQGTLFIDEYLFADPQAAADSLCQLFQERRLPGVELHEGITTTELKLFLQMLNGAVVGAEEFDKVLQKHQIRHIRCLPEEQEETAGRQSARKIFGRALKVVNAIFKDVRMGRIPSSDEAHKVVRDMARMTLADPHALLALSLLKSYDNYTFTHSVNVSVLALAVGRAAGLSEEALRTLGVGSLLHDVGKLKIDLAIINKPGRLTEKEFTEIRKHPSLGAEILQQMEGMSESVVKIVLGHHLHYDRQGYPQHAQLRGPHDLIDMTTIADTYDATTTLRPYHRPLTPRQAIENLRTHAGTMLHPHYLEQFVQSLGTYPVGTLVRLDNNEIGVVGKVGIENPDSVQLKILFDRQGEQLEAPRLLKLAAHEKKRIVAEVDPFIKGIEVIDYL